MMAEYEIRTGMSGKDTQERIRCVPGAWRVVCSENCAERVRQWMPAEQGGHSISGRVDGPAVEDSVMSAFLAVLQKIPNILFPLSPPTFTDGEWSYPVRTPDPEDNWFSAERLKCIRDFQPRRLTLPMLWMATVRLCNILSDLLDLGVWGFADRSHVLLRLGRGTDCQVCLSGVVNFHIYQSDQSYPRLSVEGENPVTTALRTLIGSVALCADSKSQAEWLKRTKVENSPLEEQIGYGSTEILRSFFHIPSDLLPEVFLSEARRHLTAAACPKDMEWVTIPSSIRMYLVLLGADCSSRNGIPVISKAASAFSHALERLQQTETYLPPAKITCIYPWETVQIRSIEPDVIPAVSSLLLDKPPAESVRLGRILECLNHLLEEDVEHGTAPLVCYIVLTDSSRLTRNFMDEYYMQELARKLDNRVFEAVLCTESFPSNVGVLMNYDILFRPKSAGEYQVSSGGELSRAMFQKTERLLKSERYSLREKADETADDPYLETWEQWEY